MSRPQAGMKAKAEREAKVEKIKEDLARLEEWLCPICCAPNTGLADVCQNVVKTGGKLVGGVQACRQAVTSAAMEKP